MKHWVFAWALVALVVFPRLAGAVETMRIAVAQDAAEVVVSARGLQVGPDTEEASFEPAADRVVVRRVDGRLQVGGRTWWRPAVRFRAPGAPVRVGKTTVQGDVVVRLGKSGLQLINVLALEEYLVGVLAGEMPVSFPDEALRAQAVAARTYALHKKLAALGQPFYLGSDVLSQVYRGLSAGDERARAAVVATHGQVLTYELTPVEAYFHASCGGRTESGREALARDLPYLQSVECPCGQLPTSRWQLTVPAADVGEPGVRVASKSRSGRVLQLRGTGGHLLDAVSLRERLGYKRLKSLMFEVTSAEGGGYHFEGRGYGHGAGLCQWGAKVLAERGWTFDRILAHYYPGTELQTLY